MAKASGGTRGSNPRSMYGSSNTPADIGMTPAQFQRFVNDIANNEYPVGWSDLDDASRELALMEAGFTGIASEDADDIMFENSKDEMSRLLTDTMLNNWESDRWDDDYMVTVGYKDGTMRTNGEIEPARAITGRQSIKTQFRIVNQTLFGRNVAYVTLYSPFGAYYWSAKGDDTILRHTGYEKWTNGRGTKRRDYIQDDWI